MTESSPAPPPSGEAADPSLLLSGTADPSRRIGTITLPSRLRLTAAGRSFDALLDWFAWWCRRVFGEVEFTIGNYCETCQDVHADGVKCPRAMIGRCLDCGRWRALDRFGNCAKYGHHSITSRRLRWPNAHKKGATA